MGIFNFGKKKPVETVIIKKEFNSSVEAFEIHNKYTSSTQILHKTMDGYLPKINPAIINDLYSESPLHSAIINFETLLTSGNGFVIDNMPEDMKSIISINQLTVQFDDSINAATQDYFLHSRIHFLITWNEDNTKILKIKRLAPDTVHINDLDAQNEPINFLYNWNWLDKSNNKTVKYAKFDQLNTKDKEQIFMWQGVSPGKKLYADVDYSSSIKWILIDSEMATYHSTNIENSLNPSLLVQFFEKPETPEEKTVILRDLVSSFAGARKTGRAMLTFSNGKELSPIVTQMEPNKLDKTFLGLTDTVQRQICYSHSVDPILVGLKIPGSLGNSQELEYQYNLFNQSKIQPAQRIIEKIYNSFLAINGLGVKIKLVDVNIVLPKDEGESRFGDAPKEEEINMTEDENSIVINENLKNLTGRQQQGMLRIMRQHKKGTLTYDQAAVLLQSSFGLDDDQIKIILGTEED